MPPSTTPEANEPSRDPKAIQDELDKLRAHINEFDPNGRKIHQLKKLRDHMDKRYRIDTVKVVDIPESYKPSEITNSTVELVDVPESYNIRDLECKCIGLFHLYIYLERNRGHSCFPYLKAHSEYVESNLLFDEKWKKRRRDDEKELSGQIISNEEWEKSHEIWKDICHLLIRILISGGLLYLKATDEAREDVQKHVLWKDYTALMTNIQHDDEIKPAYLQQLVKVVGAHDKDLLTHEYNPEAKHLQDIQEDLKSLCELWRNSRL